ncbi:hypothetical protein [Ilumatobacter sp.]|uniref:hypothetical protein n=1 Tax=Ilumatobacter sp. TaxID=1967498 RepID=UPI003B52F87E
MTDQIDQITETDAEIEEAPVAGSSRGRRMFLTGAGIAGAAALAGKAGGASAADGDNVVVGGDFEGDSPTSFTNTSTDDTAPGTQGGEALVGDIVDAGNGSHAIRGNTNGVGHAVAGTVPASNADNSVAATWGKHDNGQGAGVGGVNGATDVDLAGPARGVEGLVLENTNGSHAVFGATVGAGHSIAGDTPADATGPDGTGQNTTAATWGRHQGIGAGIGGISVGGYGGEFVGGKSHVRLIQVDNSDLGDDETAVDGPPTDDDHENGELFVDGNGTLYLYNGSSWSSVTTTQAAFTDAQRAYDSREGLEPGDGDDNKGRISSGETTTIDLTTYTDFTAGSVSASISVTVTSTDAIGYLTVFNGDTDDDDRPTVSQVTWGMAGTRTTNSFPVSVGSDGTIKVYCGEGSCDFVVDVSG